MTARTCTARALGTAFALSHNNSAVNLAGWISAIHMATPPTYGQCFTEVAFVPREGGQYLVEYRYRQDGVCEVRCRRVLGEVDVPDPTEFSVCEDVEFGHRSDAGREAQAQRPRVSVWERFQVLGIEVEDLTSGRAEALGLDVEGLLVTGTSSATPASIREGDVITHLGYGAGVASMIDRPTVRELRRAKVAEGDKLVLRRHREGAEHAVVLE